MLISEVAFLFADPLSTAVMEKGLTSRGLSVILETSDKVKVMCDGIAGG